MLKQYGRQLSWIWMGADAVVATLTFASLLAIPGMVDVHRPGGVSTAFVVGASITAGVVNVLIMERFALYGGQRRWSFPKRFWHLLGAQGLTCLVLSTAALLLDAPVDRILPFAYAMTFFCVQSVVRATAYGFLGLARRRGSNFRNVLIVGAGPLAAAARGKILSHPEWGHRIVGFVDDGDASFVPSVPLDEMHKVADLPMLLRNESVDEVLVACPRGLIGSLEPLVRECALIGVPVILLSDLFGDVLPPPRVGRFDSLSTLRFAPVHHDGARLFVKRAMDVAGAMVGLVIALPVLAVSALCIRIDSPGPVFFRQVRCGRNGRRFVMLKLRTMVRDAEARKADLLELNEMDGPVFKIASDPRVTRVGQVLRKWSIDELPQLWNVLVGEMSLIGPRPPTPDEVLQYEGSDRRRLSMRPGLTCLWQVSGRNEIGFGDWMAMDLQYIDNWSLSKDLAILFATIPTVLSGRGAS